mgnify:CR=1 FL=1
MRLVTPDLRRAHTAFFKRNRDLAATGRFIPGVNAVAAVAGKHPLGKG